MCSGIHHATVLEEKDDVFDDRGSSSTNIPRLLANTPTFYPRQTAKIIQLVGMTSGASNAISI
ncbi:hypothetical protein GN244_ATG17799 [Phytophthora infestans]|uniref:Uncharacterized protein n=1 Tax=Phytophthora infestans TaxID=4787 RepID=A0A833SIP8_PHYIN|nr:hypothetical protein GN244_ATG17799 [Phytophthora infestans]